jgi:putative DNA primase/helicase
LLNAARSFNEYVEPERTISHASPPQAAAMNGDRPGDLFNAGAQWEEILLPHGWTQVGQRGEVTLWKRPGKREQGISATTDYAGSGLLYVFSTNASPFEPETAYSKFAAYALLEYECCGN